MSKETSSLSKTSHKIGAGCKIGIESSIQDRGDAFGNDTGDLMKEWPEL
jgi:hypothetical protein